ncbi:MAG: sodium:proton antiporter [Verrucomicrobia bacterium]|nr:sodium:proton antiporter [Verrucomicrobiota bacterium]
MAGGLFAALGPNIPAAWLIPFGLLLLLIAVMPLGGERLKHAWERYYPFVSIGLAALVGAYYLVKVPAGNAVLGHALHEYVSFIALIGALFVVAGGIHLRVKGEATPAGNVLFLLVGAILANVIGTTGASVVLIRPWIRMNQDRVRPYHIVFFIFVVSNVGGALTPIGDPPLFLGYLRGVPFFWLIQHVWKEWAFTVIAILAVFYAIDRRNFRRLPAKVPGAVVIHDDTFGLQGRRNLVLLAAIVAGVFLPEKYFIREAAMLAAATLSWVITPKRIHDANRFNFHPIKEVAFLFVGIFTTMMPALNYLEAHGSRLGFTRPAHYYYATGGLSAVLDNAPTYVNFLKLAEITFVEETAEDVAEGPEGYDRRAVGLLLENYPGIVVAISLGAVFFGAMTYIGNGPNFMVKSIAEAAGVRCPGFLGYVFRYSLPVLLPILTLGAWLFL